MSKSTTENFKDVIKELAACSFYRNLIRDKICQIRIQKLRGLGISSRRKKVILK